MTNFNEMIKARNPKAIKHLKDGASVDEKSLCCALSSGNTALINMVVNKYTSENKPHPDTLELTILNQASQQIEKVVNKFQIPAQESILLSLAVIPNHGIRQQIINAMFNLDNPTYTISLPSSITDNPLNKAVLTHNQLAFDNLLKEGWKADKQTLLCIAIINNDDLRDHILKSLTPKNTAWNQYKEEWDSFIEREKNKYLEKISEAYGEVSSFKNDKIQIPNLENTSRNPTAQHLLSGIITTNEHANRKNKFANGNTHSYRTVRCW